MTLVEVDCADHLRGLRDGSLDGGFMRLPVREGDLHVGQPFLTENRMLAVPIGHRLADREMIGAEELAEETFVEIPHSAPRYWTDFHMPPSTPSGRPIARGPKARTVQDALGAVALARAVHPIGDRGARYYARPDVRFVPVDLPAVHTAFTRRAHDERVMLEALEVCALAVAHQSARPERAAQPAASGRL